MDQRRSPKKLRNQILPNKKFHTHPFFICLYAPRIKLRLVRVSCRLHQVNSSPPLFQTRTPKIAEQCTFFIFFQTLQPHLKNLQNKPLQRFLNPLSNRTNSSLFYYLVYHFFLMPSNNPFFLQLFPPGNEFLSFLPSYIIFFFSRSDFTCLFLPYLYVIKSYLRLNLPSFNPEAFPLFLFSFFDGHRNSTLGKHYNSS